MNVLASKDPSYCNNVLEPLEGLMRQVGDELHAGKMKDLQKKWVEEEFTIAFCGHFSAGKSSLINRLCGRRILPSSPIPTSANVVRIHHGEARAEVTLMNAEVGVPKQTKAVAVENLEAYCVNGAEIESVDIYSDLPFLGARAQLLDTPGVDSVDDAHRQSTESALHTADIVFYVMDYNHVQSEINFVFAKQLVAWGKPLYVIVNQIDKHREREISFAAYRKGVEQAFAAWHVKPAGILYLSLKMPEHPEDESDKLTWLLNELLQRQTVLLQAGIRGSVKQLAASHLLAHHHQLEPEREQWIQAMGGLDAANELEQQLNVLEAEYAKLLGQADAAEQRFKAELTDILDHANIIPAETRELADHYLQSCKAGFKVGMLFTAGKTEMEQKRRLEAVHRHFSDQVRAHIDWHTKDVLRKLTEQAGVPADVWAFDFDKLLMMITPDWLAERVNADASFTNEYTMNYAKQISSDAKAMYRKEVLALAERLFMRLRDACVAQAAVVHEQLDTLLARSAALSSLRRLDEGERAHAARLRASAALEGGAGDAATSGLLPDVADAVRARSQAQGAARAATVRERASGAAAASGSAASGELDASGVNGSAAAGTGSIADKLDGDAIISANATPSGDARVIDHSGVNAGASNASGVKARATDSSASDSNVSASDSNSSDSNTSDSDVSVNSTNSGDSSASGTNASAAGAASGAARVRAAAAAAAARLRRAQALLAPYPAMKSLGEGLQRKAKRLEDSRFTIALFGAFSAGKSSFANALIGEDVLPVSPNPTTAAINQLMAPTAEFPHGTAEIHMKTREAMLEDIAFSLSMLGMEMPSIGNLLPTLRQLKPEQVQPAGRPHYSFLQAVARGWTATEPLLGTSFTADLDMYRAYVAEEDKSCFVRVIHLHYHCPLTEQGIVLVDTPGADSINARHTGVSFNYIQNADAILFVTYYNHAFSQADRQFLAQLGRVKDSFELDKMFFIVNAADLANSEEELHGVLEYVGTQLQSYGIRFPRLYPVSSLQALEGKQTGNAAQLQAAGLPVFEEEFVKFTMEELGQLAIQSGDQDIRRAQHMIEQWIIAAQADEQAKQRQYEQLLQAEAQALHTADQLRTAHIADQPRISQEVQELLFYVKQRIRYRFGEIFAYAYNPATLRQDSQDLKRAYESCGLELHRLLTIELSQELQATTLRLVKKLLEWLHAHTETSISSVQQTLPHFEMHSIAEAGFTHPTVEEQHAMPELDAKQLWSMFKNPKYFFEAEGKKAVREKLAQVYQLAIDSAVQTHTDRFTSHYTADYEKLLQEVSSQLKIMIHEQNDGLRANLTQQADVVQLQQLVDELNL